LPEPIKAAGARIQRTAERAEAERAGRLAHGIAVIRAALNANQLDEAERPLGPLTRDFSLEREVQSLADVLHWRERQRLVLWAKEQGVADTEPLFFSRKRDADGRRRALQRGQAWLIVKEASERANVRVLALRASKHGPPGEAAPVHPHLFRHARVRQIVRSTRNLPLAQRQAGWSRLQMAYLTIGDEEARQLMQELTE